MEEQKNGFTAKPCIFNGASGYMVYQYVSGAVIASQFVRSLSVWCMVQEIPLESITIID